jgi:hypothetical protein
LGVGKRNATEGGKCSHFYSQFIGITITAAIENPRSFMKKRIIDEYGRNRIFSEKRKKKHVENYIENILSLN